MTVYITIAGKRTPKEIPTAYDQLSFSRFLELSPAIGNPSKILSILTGVEEEIINRSVIENLSEVLQILSFLNYDMIHVLPQKIIVEGKEYPIPKDLEFKTIAQYEDLKAIMNKFGSDNLENAKLYPSLIATYCVDYSVLGAWKMAEDLAPKLFDLPCTEVMAIGNFTLVKLIALKGNVKPHFPLVGIQASKFKLAMIVWLKRLAFTIRYYLWKSRHPSIGPNSLAGR